ncbi:MAG: TetR family transcriptional regulator C-terminal domain-containing protein [Alphaproteobacteria bacterium]|nr:TetR family transcriptional regulator C-terminal domain-containing protein [Alphaproteobacteria bacterium]
MARAAETRRRTRIQEEKETLILASALAVFAQNGFAGTTLDDIARLAGMSKPNLIYYFASKEEIYRAVLGRTLETWLEPLIALDPSGEPLAEIRGYIRRKLEISRDRPQESRLFAGEILAGAPLIRDALEADLKNLVDEKVAVIRGWIADGKLADHDPYHLIFAIWATTQHYADFDVQVQSVLGKGIDEASRYAGAERFMEDVILGGLRPDS